MAFVTRSTRQPEGFPALGRHVDGHTSMTRATAALFHAGAQQKQRQKQKQQPQQQQQQPQPQPQGRRTKRVLDATECDIATTNTIKKTKTAVEIVTRSAEAPVSAPVPAPAPAPAPIRVAKQKVRQQQLQQPTIPPVEALEEAKAPARAAAAPQTTSTAAVQVQATTPSSHLARAALVDRSNPGLPPSRQDSDLPNHQKKVINGIKHDLDRLQPQMAATKKPVRDPVREPGRKLRSQEATRFKSELSAYFPDYDEVIGNEPKEQHLLNFDTPIIVVDSNPPPAPRLGASQFDPFPVRGYGDALYTDVSDAQKIDFGFLEAQHNNRLLVDPLPDSTFELVHRRAERLERSIRNTEKGRAQHERDQIVRLLEDLQGHDWLRVMGVSGITETKKRRFEPAREHFIQGCQAILDKFKNWSLEEKRRKLQRERTLAEQAQEELREAEAARQKDLEMEDANESTFNGDTNGDDNDLDGEDDSMASQDNNSEVSVSSSSPAKQLRQEAMARSKVTTSKRSRSDLALTTPQQQQHDAPKEFTSFFNKKHERDSALNPHRRAGRKILAWGHPIPYIEEADFDLPEDYRDDEMLKSRARKRRRERRSKP